MVKKYSSHLISFVCVFFLARCSGSVNDDFHPGVLTTDVANISIRSVGVLDSDASVNFGSHAIGDSSDITFTVQNDGDNEASAMSQRTAAPFSFKGGTYPGTGGTCSETLAAKNSCTFVLSFSPTTTGTVTVSAQLSYFDGRSEKHSSVSLTGTGTVPSLTANARLWLDAQDTATLFSNQDCSTGAVTNAGERVGCWKDKSANGIHFIQETDSKRPTYVDDFKNLKGVYFVGANAAQLVNRTTAILPQGGATLFYAIEVPAGDANRQIMDMGATGGWRRTFAMDWTGNLFYSQNSDAFYFYANHADSLTFRRVTVVEDVSSGSLSISGGVATATGALSGAPIASGTPTTLGGRFTENAYYSNSRIGEILIYDSVLSSEDCSIIERYLDAKYSF